MSPALMFALGAVALAVVGGLIMARYFTLALKRIYAVPKNPDELEKLVELEASKKMKAYYLFCLILLAFLFNDRFNIQILHYKFLAFAMIAFGWAYERIVMRKIAESFSSPLS